MKRILIFSLAYYPHVGGAEVAIREITNRLGHDFSFDLITLGEPTLVPEEIGTVRVYRVGGTFSALGKLLFPFRAATKAQSLHARHPYDMTWGMMAAYAGFAALFFKMRNPHVPFLLTLQEGDPISHIQRRALPVYPLFRRIFLRADRIQAISTYLVQFARGMGYTGSIDVVPNGVDVAHFSKSISALERTTLRSSMGIRDTDIVLITASRLVHKNGIDDVIRALANLPSNVHFVIAGTGSERATLEALAHEELDRVHFIGFISHEQLPSYLHAADIFIRASRSEGMGNAFIEAMAARLPVIATQEGGIADFLYDSRRNPDKLPTGFAVDADAPRQIADAVTSILSEPDHTKAIVSNAYALVVRRYDWTTIAPQMKSVFERTLAAR